MDSAIFKWILVLLLTLSVSACAVPQADFYVSVDGNDQWSGKLPSANESKTDGPFKTMTKARDAVSEKLAGMNKDIVVMIRGGKYFLDNTVVFGLEDSGMGEHKVIYRNYPEEEPIFTSGVNITGWKKLDADLPGLPEVAKGKIWVTDVPKFLSRFYTLYDGEQCLPRARGDGFEALDEYETWRGPDHYSLRFPKGAMKNWSNLNDAEILIRPTAAWVMNYLPLESVDEKKGVARTAVCATYLMGKLRWHGGKNVWVENVLDVLDKPGEWVLDADSNRLYMWPHGEKPSDKIYAPKLVEFVRVEGRIDYDGPKDTPVRNIVFQGLTFTQGDRFQRTNKHIGRGLQHDWEMFDAPTATIRFRGAEGCAVNSCNFINSGATAIRLDLHCQENRISNNEINSIGGCGILLAGYGPGTKDVNKKNAVFNNHIQKIGQLYWHCPGIFVWQSGENLISNNLIHNTPYTGIAISGRIQWDISGIDECSKTIRWQEVEKYFRGEIGDGNWQPRYRYAKSKADEILSGNITALDWIEREVFLHSRSNIVEKNEIRDVMEILGDGNAIYVSGAGGGNLVRLNYIHDLGRGCQAAIRTDDDQHETVIEKNTMWKCKCTGFVLKGKNNFINNIIADCGYGDPVDEPRKSSYVAMRLGPVEGSKIKRNIFYSSEGDAITYEYGKTDEQPTHIKDCFVDYNIYFSPKNPNWEKENLIKRQKEGIEDSSVVVDPLFVDSANGDFRLKADSPALKLGFQQIDVSKIGLTKDFPK